MLLKIKGRSGVFWTHEKYQFDYAVNNGEPEAEFLYPKNTKFRIYFTEDLRPPDYRYRDIYLETTSIIEMSEYIESEKDIKPAEAAGAEASGAELSEQRHREQKLQEAEVEKASKKELKKLNF